MKKFYAMLLCVIVAASSMSVSAKKWRMFTDCNVGYGVTGAFSQDDRYGISGMMLLSGGFQYKFAFLGLGTGYIPPFDEIHEVALYAHLRLDFFKKDPKSFSPFSPFLSYRIGYSFSISGNCGSGFFAEISGGIRKGLTENLGLNLGLSVATYGKALHYHTDWYSDTWGVFFNVGLDF